jgi:hypothetical protein
MSSRSVFVFFYTVRGLAMVPSRSKKSCQISVRFSVSKVNSEVEQAKGLTHKGGRRRRLVRPCRSTSLRRKSWEVYCAECDVIWQLKLFMSHYRSHASLVDCVWLYSLLYCFAYCLFLCSFTDWRNSLLVRWLRYSLVRFQVRREIFFLPEHQDLFYGQTSVFCNRCGGCFPGSKAAEAWSCLLDPF